jgi:hypothetical protein
VFSSAFRNSNHEATTFELRPSSESLADLQGPFEIVRQALKAKNPALSPFSKISPVNFSDFPEHQSQIKKLAELSFLFMHPMTGAIYPLTPYHLTDDEGDDGKRKRSFLECILRISQIAKKATGPVEPDGGEGSRAQAGIGHEAQLLLSVGIEGKK